MRSKKKILWVDDSETSLMLGRMLLGKGTYELVSARDGEEGVRVALAEVPDLILMDVIMPRLGGMDALRQLRAQPTTRGIPVILVTTRSEAESMEAGFRNGCTDYVTKPIDGSELIGKVRSMLGA